MRHPFPPHCSGQVSSKVKQELSSRPVGTLTNVECPKCHSSVESFVTPLHDVQMRPHYSPRIMKLYDIAGREERSRELAKELSKELEDDDDDDVVVYRV
jgi:hypothetical protein